MDELGGLQLRRPANRRKGERDRYPVLKFMCRVSLSPDGCVRQTETVFERYGAAALLIAKFVPGLARVAPPLAGTAARRAQSGAGAGTLTYVTDETRHGRRGYAPETGRPDSDLMKPTATRLRGERRQRSEAVLEKHLADLFRRLPMLAGFTLREDLEVSDVAVHSWPGHVAGEELYKDLMVALTNLADERPEAIELLRGRTFARALH